MDDLGWKVQEGETNTHNLTEAEVAELMLHGRCGVALSHIKEKYECPCIAEPRRIVGAYCEECGRASPLF